MLNHNKKSNSGCKPYDVVMMFKIIVIKRLYSLSDENTEYEINDRLSFKEYLKLSSGDRVPDARTIWLFQNKLIEEQIEERLFAEFHKYLERKGLLLVNSVKIVDETLVEVPRQRNEKVENENIKLGKVAELWGDNPHKRRQKDIEARWTIKRGKRFYGYKSHNKDR